MEPDRALSLQTKKQKKAQVLAVIRKAKRPAEISGWLFVHGVCETVYVPPPTACHRENDDQN